jgi:hypothetical protein
MNNENRANLVEAASLLRRFARGEASNREFEKVFSEDAEERILFDIFLVFFACYDDFVEQHMIGPQALSPESRELAERCALFLEAGLPYQWLSRSIGARIVDWFLGRDSRPVVGGDESVWPFFQLLTIVRF